MTVESPAVALASRIIVMRGQRVMIDADLAALYGIETKVFNQAIKRNRKRFPADFVFELTAVEKEYVVTNCDHLTKLKYSRTLPHAFTEHGAIMAATILNSPRAIEMSVFVVRAFVELRGIIANSKQLAGKLDLLERKVLDHDTALSNLVKAIRQLNSAPVPKKRPIGFTADLDEAAH